MGSVPCDSFFGPLWQLGANMFAAMHTFELSGGFYPMPMDTSETNPLCQLGYNPEFPFEHEFETAPQSGFERNM